MTPFRILTLCALLLTAAAPAAGTGLPERYVVDVRVIEIHADGKEWEATQVQEVVDMDEVANLYVWWGKHDGAGGAIEPVGEGIVGDQPLLGDHAWAAVWQVQASIIDKAGTWSVGLRLNRANFDGLTEGGRPAYRRKVRTTSYVDTEGHPRRFEMIAFDPPVAERLGVVRVMVEVKVVPEAPPGS